MKIRSNFIAAAAGVLIGVFCWSNARADVISETFNQPLTATPVAVSFDGVGSFLFTTVTTGYGPGAWVATSGSAAQVTSLFGTVTDFEANSSIDQTGELYTFASYTAPQMIPFSAADDFIGLQLTLKDGVHYGYAEVDGPDLVGIGFQSTAGTSILTGATGTSSTGITLSSGTATATPEPASIALLATGLAMLSARRRRAGDRLA